MPIEVPIRFVKDIKPAIEQFLLKFSNIKISISDPWFPYPNYVSKNDTIDGFGKTGIYIFSKPNLKWNIPLEENNSEIWYIGKTEENNKSIRGRVWNHLEPMGEGKRVVLVNGKHIEALFAAKEWDSRSEVSQMVRDSIVLGKFVVYGIRLEGLNEVGSLESYLIKSYENTNGIKPVFNKKS